MDKMFCFQCEQSARLDSMERPLKGCTRKGICGKTDIVARTQDELAAAIINLAVAAEGQHTADIVDLLVDGLFTDVTNVNFDADTVLYLKDKIHRKIIQLQGAGSEMVAPQDIFRGDENILSLRATLLLGLRGMAAYAHHARNLGYRDKVVDAGFVEYLALLMDEHSTEQWLQFIMGFGKINLQCMKLLDQANTECFGDPSPQTVSLLIESGPFIVVSGHDLQDLALLLEQTKDKGVAVYTHGEMLPAHGYPKLRAYKHLKGNFGTAWQNQQHEFADIPGAILFTSNCIMPVRESYRDCVFTTSVVRYPDTIHIDQDSNGYKDFAPLIDKALALGGYPEAIQQKGVNEGIVVTAGYGRQYILDHAQAVLDAIDNGSLQHIFLVGGCDGAKPGRSYYTEFVEQAPEDTIVLTLACGKYRFNDLQLGKLGPFERVMDMGQCNDAYGAIEVALALAEALDCDVNQLPLTLVLSWYEQKAVCVLLTLLAIGIKNIYIGPSLPAFFSADVLVLLVENFGIKLINDATKDITAILEG